MASVIALKPAFKPAPRKMEATCATCHLRELCMPSGLCMEDLERVQGVVYARRRVKRGEPLFVAGAEASALYAVRSGFFKTSVLDGEGREQVTGFFMGGEILGLDGMSSDHYHATAVALEDSEVCVLPYARIEEIARQVPALSRHLNRLLAREIVRDQGVMLLLGSMRAEERLATFLLNLSKRFAGRGYSASDFHLRMTREEIGSYLGLKLETVSRLFSQLQAEGVIEVQQKHVRIVDAAALERILAGAN